MGATHFLLTVSQLLILTHKPCHKIAAWRNKMSVVFPEVESGGIEPQTLYLQGGCSTTTPPILKSLIICVTSKSLKNVTLANVIGCKRVHT